MTSAKLPAIGIAIGQPGAGKRKLETVSAPLGLSRSAGEWAAAMSKRSEATRIENERVKRQTEQRLARKREKVGPRAALALASGGGVGGGGYS